MGRSHYQLTTSSPYVNDRRGTQEARNLKGVGYCSTPAASEHTKTSQTSPNKNTVTQAQSSRPQSGYRYAPAVYPQGCTTVQEGYGQTLVFTQDHQRPRVHDPNNECPQENKVKSTHSHRPTKEVGREKWVAVPSDRDWPSLKKGLYGVDVCYGSMSSKHHHRLQRLSGLNVPSEASSSRKAYSGPVSPNHSYLPKSSERLNLGPPERFYQEAKQSFLLSPSVNPPQCHRHHPELEVGYYNAGAVYNSGIDYNAPSQSCRESSQEGVELFNARDIYDSANTEGPYTVQPKLERAVLAASHGTRADKNRLARFKNGSHERSNKLIEELDVEPQELDDLSRNILGDIMGAFYGREDVLLSAVQKRF
ncbi:hypothetical protein OPQ81_002890 [Rhizoctonia solani]|nr:hypothetical protein OPQ81_002890 [Rhizoctonia solani]